MPPSGFGKRSIRGLLEFVRGNYEDLKAEVESGKHASFEEAFDHEIATLETALQKLHINDDGDLVERDQE